MERSIEYGIDIDSQTMKYIFHLPPTLPPPPPVSTLSSYLLCTDHSPLLSAGEKSH